MQADALFTHYMIAGVETVLARVQAAPYVVPEADRQQAWHLLSFALKVEAAWPATRALLLALAPKMELAGFREEWIPYLDKGRQCAQQIGDLQVVAECELQMGMLYRLMSRFEEAHHWTETSIEHFNICGVIDGEARSLNELAWLEHLENHYQDATKHVEQALNLLDNGTSERALSYRIQGMIAFYQGNLQDAINYHQQSLKIFTQQLDQRRSAWSLQNLAIAFQRQHEFQEAFAYHQKAITILTNIGDISNLGVAKMNLGSTYYHSGNSNDAVALLRDAEVIAYRLNDKLQLARINTHLGLAYLALNHYEVAEQVFQTSIDYYTTLEDLSWKLNAMDGLAMTYLKSRQYNKAVVTLQQAMLSLPEIINAPNHDYLRVSLTKHLKEAERGEASK